MFEETALNTKNKMLLDLRLSKKLVYLICRITILRNLVYYLGTRSRYLNFRIMAFQNIISFVSLFIHVQIKILELGVIYFLNNIYLKSAQKILIS